MVGFCDFDGVGIAPVSNKMAVKYATFLGGFFNFLTIEPIGSPQNSVFNVRMQKLHSIEAPVIYTVAL